MPHPNRRLGKRPARIDHRVHALARRMRLGALPTPPPYSNWYAAQAQTGIPLLANGTYGNCVECSVAHFLAAISRYVDPLHPLVPTDQETLAIYTAVTGFNPNDPSTDNGTYFMGAGGMVEYWIKNGVTIGGVLNKPAAVVTVDHTDQYHLRQAINLFGFVFTGAQMRDVDVQSNFMWEVSHGPIIGGHEFLICGYEEVDDRYYYDIETWDGMWRASGDWIANSVDETAVVLDRAFVNAAGIDPAGISWGALELDANLISSTS